LSLIVYSYLKKNQIGAGINNHLLSYTKTVVNNKLYVIFSDQPHSTTDLMYSPVVVVELNSEGQQRKQILYQPHQAEVYLFPRSSVQVGGNRIALYGVFDNGKEFRYGQLTINE
jgi:hypothetical protein